MQCLADAAPVTQPADKPLLWSLEPIKFPSPPMLIASDPEAWKHNPIDAFVLAKLREQGLTPSPPADRRTLIRRLTFDLIGLPPTSQEVAEFVADPSPDAYERAVDRLLGSPHYGERWARQWMDVVRYGDTHGFDKDKPRPHAWPYRDYLVRSFNSDKAYSRFVKEQLAGDYFFPESADGVIALGFIAAGPWDFVGQVELREGTVDKAITRNLDRDDMVAATANTFLSLTVQCARCHDHKFDPISQKEYYALQAVFAGVDRADRTFDSDPNIAIQRRQLKARRAAITADSLADRDSRLAAIDAKLKALPPEEVVFAAASDFKAEGSFTPTGGEPRPIHLLRRGSEKSPAEEVGPAALTCVKELDSRSALAPDHAEAARRAALADWIVQRDNPLTWRSIVNRAWQQHFGRGIVETPSDFGRMGSGPTHPELLDYLAAQFRDGGESIKAIDRLIVTSAAYRQSSADDPRGGQIDSDNRYLWRMNRRRLDAEQTRDAVLAVAGVLDERLGGPSFKAFGFADDHSPRYQYAESNPDDPATLRRSIYRFIVRSVPDPFFEALDCADPSQSVPRRNETMTALQAMALLNDKFMVRMAEHFAQRVERVSPDVSKQIVAATAIALGRLPTSEEADILANIAQKHGLANACRLIFNMSEFAYID